MFVPKGFWYGHLALAEEENMQKTWEERVYTCGGKQGRSSGFGLKENIKNPFDDFEILK